MPGAFPGLRRSGSGRIPVVPDAAVQGWGAGCMPFKAPVNGQDGNARPLIAAGMLMGTGMGAFVDGILFHEILQLHNMLSNVVPRDSLVNEELNMFWDGIFHAFAWMMTSLAVWMLWRAMKRGRLGLPGWAYFGAALCGWGEFNVVEGVIDHEILQIHHVYQNGSFLLWDIVFLCSGIVLIGVGWFIIRSHLNGWPAEGQPAVPTR